MVHLKKLEQNFLFKITDTSKTSVKIKQFVSSTHYVQGNEINIYFLLSVCHPVLEASVLVLVLTVFMNLYDSRMYMVLF